MLISPILSCGMRELLLLYFKEKVSLEEQKAQKEDRFLRGRQIAFMIYNYFRVTGAHHTVLDFADLFSITLRNDNVQVFNTRWDKNLLSKTKIPSDDILESLNKVRIREFGQLKTVLELHDMEIHQKISMPNYQKLKTMVKRSIDQKPRLENETFISPAWLVLSHGMFVVSVFCSERDRAASLEGYLLFMTKQGICSWVDAKVFRHTACMWATWE